jgi:hypothetical protein
MSVERRLPSETLIRVPFLGITLVHVVWDMIHWFRSLFECSHLMQLTWCLRTLCSQAWKACLVFNFNHVYIVIIISYFFMAIYYINYTFVVCEINFNRHNIGTHFSFQNCRWFSVIFHWITIKSRRRISWVVSLRPNHVASHLRCKF